MNNLDLQATLDRTVARLERLEKWLQLIDGGDRPCLDESKLRQAAYDALQGREPPEAL